MTDVPKAFKRVNFFRGFLATEEDFNDATQYHVENRRLHNRVFHGLGTVPGYLGELRVRARGKGELAVEVLPGLAVDGSGDQIFMADPEIKAINPLDYKLPQTVFVVAKYYEELSDFIAYKENIEYKGHRRMNEVGKIELTVVEPEPAEGVELARINLAPGVKRVTDAKDPANPDVNEIDLRFVPKAIAFGSRIDASLLHFLTEMVDEVREVFAFLNHEQKISTAGDVSHAAITLLMMLRSRLVNLSNLQPIFDDVLRLQWAFVEDVDAHHPEFSNRKEFASLKRHIELLLDFSKTKACDAEYVQTLTNYEMKSCENLRAIFSERLARVVEEKGPATPLEKIAETLKVHSKAFKKTMKVEGAKLKRVDELNILDTASEAEHDFKIIDFRDKYRSRQKLRYPDGNIVEDVGVAYEGGRCEFTLKNVVPGRPLLLLVRMDYVHGDWEAAMDVNGKRAGVMRCPGGDRKFRWRNWPFIVDAEFVNDVELKITQTPVTEERDINYFHIWAYQPDEA